MEKKIGQIIRFSLRPEFLAPKSAQLIQNFAQSEAQTRLPLETLGINGAPSDVAWFRKLSR